MLRERKNARQAAVLEIAAGALSFRCGVELAPHSRMVPRQPQSTSMHRPSECPWTFVPHLPLI
jgi:hypothetical protein